MQSALEEERGIDVLFQSSLCHEQCRSQLVHPAGWYAAGQRGKGDGTPEAEVIIRLPEVVIFLAGMCLGVEHGNLWTESNNER